MSRNLKRRYKKGGAPFLTFVSGGCLIQAGIGRNTWKRPIAIIHGNFRLLFGVPTMMGGGRSMGDETK